jgi:hypothetical protein
MMFFNPFSKKHRIAMSTSELLLLASDSESMRDPAEAPEKVAARSEDVIDGHGKRFGNSVLYAANGKVR